MVAKDVVQASKKGQNMMGCYSKKMASTEEMLLPFKSVRIVGVLEGPVATLDIDLIYVNPEQDHPVECSYEFPLDKETIFAKLVCTIDDK